MVLRGNELKQYLQSKIIPEEKRNDTNNYPEKVAIQTRRANSKWLSQVANSGAFNSMYNTISVISFIPDRTNNKKPVCILGKRINFMKTIAFADSPGRFYLQNKDKWLTCDFWDLYAAIDETFPVGWKNMKVQLANFVQKGVSIGDQLRSEYADIYTKLDNYKEQLDLAPEKLEQLDNEIKRYINQYERGVEKYQQLQNLDVEAEIKQQIQDKVVDKGKDAIIGQILKRIPGARTVIYVGKTITEFAANPEGFARQQFQSNINSVVAATKTKGLDLLKNSTKSPTNWVKKK